MQLSRSNYSHQRMRICMYLQKSSFSRRRGAVIKFATRGQRCEKPARDVIPHTATRVNIPMTVLCIEYKITVGLTVRSSLHPSPLPRPYECVIL